MILPTVKFLSCRGLAAILLAPILLSVTACGNSGVKDGDLTHAEEIADLQVVDCLLPGQVRRLGNSTYMTPRRPAQVTAAECRIQGGEYVAYDRSDYKTALTVWMPTAKNGDAEAQTNVGQIFEKGLGGEPNYEAAVVWYTKAAEQGNARAQFNLGTLYEQGLGVAKDKLMAMNLYRQAWGLPEDSLIYQSAASKEQEILRDQLSQAVAKKELQITLLTRQIDELEIKANSDIASSAQEKAQSQAEMQELQAWVDSLRGERELAMVEINEIPRYRQPNAPPVKQIKTASDQSAVALEDMEFGKYYALIIGNQNYDTIDDLYTPHSDSLRAKEVLESQYNFDVTVLLDADNANIMRAINDLSSRLTEDDNLLIFYAGHGMRIQTGDYEAGYWLPVNAEAPPSDTFWVSNEFVTRHLARLKAKRIMVVADSCYAGLLSDAPGYLFMGDTGDYSNEYVRYKLPKKSRLLLSSGGDAPVLDNKGQGHSIFAQAFIQALEQSEGVISGPELYLKIYKSMAASTERAGVKQEPEFKAIKGAGHEVGDFFFVKQSS